MMRVANGPASTQVKSMTRSPSSGFPAAVEPRWRRPSGRGVSPRAPHRASTSSIDEGCPAAGLRGSGDAAAEESGERAGHAHVREALDRAKRPAVLVLRIRRHLGDGLDLTEGDVPALCLGEELARVLGEREPFDGRHDPGHLAEHLLDRQRGELGTFLVALLGHPLEEQRRVGGRWRCCRHRSGRWPPRTPRASAATPDAAPASAGAGDRRTTIGRTGARATT